jgi:hypothetical protein
MGAFINLKEHQLRDTIRITKLKKKFNKSATLLNTFSQEEIPVDKEILFNLIHELYLAGKEIEELNRNRRYRAR